MGHSWAIQIGPGVTHCECPNVKLALSLRLEPMHQILRSRVCRPYMIPRCLVLLVYPSQHRHLYPGSELILEF
jgi:hypothetical protein